MKPWRSISSEEKQQGFEQKFLEGTLPYTQPFGRLINFRVFWKTPKVGGSEMIQ